MTIDRKEVSNRLRNLMELRKQADDALIEALSHPDLMLEDQAMLITELFEINKVRGETDAQLISLITQLRTEYPKSKQIAGTFEWNKPEYDKYQRVTEELK